VLNLRSAVSRELEKLRNADAIGAPLDAEVDVYCLPPLLQTVEAFGEELRFVFITSAARVHPADRRPAEAVAAEDGEGNLAWVAVRPTSAVKCVRCWHKREDVGRDARHPELCGRCVTNVEGPGEQRRFT
jgi:isoleucyl-tRNA synthetase